MNILIVVDKQDTAIDRLAQAVKKYNPHFKIEILPVHPKRNDPQTLTKARRLLDWCDLLDVHYWKSGEVLRNLFPQEFAKKKKIVCHFNPYDYNKLKWTDIYDYVVVGNRDLHMKIPYAEYIPYGVDLDFFEYTEDYKVNQIPIVTMVVNRIESKKGVLEVAQACKELGYQFVLIGNVSDGVYMSELMKYDVNFFENESDEKKRLLCSTASVHVCNSADNFETGTLPILENMAMGIPVLTRFIGHVPDLFNGQNMIVRKGPKEDIEELKTNLRDIVENRDRALKIREAAYKTVKNYTDQHMARKFSRLYYRLLSNLPLVSVIIPTKNRGDELVPCLVAAINQTFQNYEVIIVDSGYQTGIESLIPTLREKTSVPIKYIHFKNEGYSLAEARNRGIIESEGDYLVFCDDRLEMDKGTVEAFAKRMKQKCFLWGVKDEYEKPFVENLSAVRRSDFIDGGMFLERMEWYGGMSQEIRTRYSRLGFAFEMVQEAKAKSITRSGNRAQKRKDLVKSKLLLFKLYG